MLAFAAALASPAVCPAGHISTINAPFGSESYIDLWVGDSSIPDIQIEVVDGPLPFDDYHIFHNPRNPDIPPIAEAHASAAANALKAYSRTRINYMGVSVYGFDTYTLHGPTGQRADIIASLAVEGRIGQSPRPDYFGRDRSVSIGAINGELGTFANSGGSLQLTRLAWDGRDRLVSSRTAVIPDLEVDFTVSRTMTLTAGTSFNLYHKLYVGTNGGVADASNTALIDFELPDGFSITSSKGWTSPSATPAAVPEPATLTLFGTGAAFLLAYGWRRQKRKQLPERAFGFPFPEGT